MKLMKALSLLSENKYSMSRMEARYKAERMVFAMKMLISY